MAFARTKRSRFQVILAMAC